MATATPQSYTCADFIKAYSTGATFAVGSVSIVKFAKSVKTEANPVERELAMKITERAKIPMNYPCEMEIEILKSIEHNKIVKLYDYFATTYHLYFVMEYIPGRSLDYYFQSRVKFTREDTAKILSDLTSGLSYLHERQIIHRDINPRNLVLDMDFNTKVKTLKIVDFGCATYLNKPTILYDLLLPFVAPEIRNSTPYGCGVDVWSAGVIFCCLIFGIDITTFDFVIHDFDIEILPDNMIPDWYSCSPLLQTLIRRMLDKDGSRRITAAEALHDSWLIIYASP